MIFPLVRVQAHPSRSHLHPALVASVDPLNVEVIVDPDPNHPRTSPLRTYRECVQPDPDFTHLVILQDDATVCADFATAVVEAIRHHPDSLIVLFLAAAPAGSARWARRARAAGEPFSEMARGDWIPTVGLVWPMKDATEFSRYLKRVQPHMWADDPIVGGWVNATKRRVVATVPSLVQHPDVEPSLIGRKAGRGKNANRVALHFTGAWP